MIFNVLLALHLLGAVLWVGGMGFALLVLRPGLSALEPPQRISLLMQVFARFFRIIWHVMPVMLLTGYAMLFGYFGGFDDVNWAVHVMHLLGLVMAAVFVIVVFGPWHALRAAQQAGDAPATLASLERVRRLVLLNLVLGFITVAVAAFA